MTKNIGKSTFLATSSMLALSYVFATAAFGQADGGDVEQVVVSASRISIAGYTQPTPVTVISAESLQRADKTDIGDIIRELPQVGNSFSASNGATSGKAAQGNAGVSNVNLRNLGVARTLVLFDGQRVVSSNPAEGGVDLSTIPSALIERIDVVTGGASAAWGSDAVSGVVNLVLNKNFTGLKGSVHYSNDDGDTHLQYKGDLSYGTDFAGDRGHVEVSAVYTMSPDQLFYAQNKWWSPQTLFPGPAGGPTYIHVSNFGSTAGTAGGLIVSSAAATTAGPSGKAAANALKGIQFVGPNANVAPFYGLNGPIYNSLCTNCSANQYTDLQAYSSNAVPYHNTTLFGYARYKLTDSIQVSLQLNYGTNFEENSIAPLRSTQTVTSGNPYIPASIQSTMTAYGIPSFKLGWYGINGTDPHNLTAMSVSRSESITNNFNNRALARGVFTVEGTIGADWSWNTYVELSELREQQHNPNNVLTANYNLAIDAVTVTAANQGTSGLPLGSIQCRSTLITPTNGCQPLNPFGTAGVSEATINFISPGRSGNLAVMDQAHFYLNQDVVEGSMQGILPWKVPAGGVAVAFGAGYRHEQQRTVGDPMNYGASAGWTSANYTAFAGGEYVYEGFGEVTVPIIKDGFVQSLDVNAAGRVTNYSTSGTVKTWKLGATSQINDDVRLRLTWSEDIRAPLLIELFQAPAFSALTTTDPKTNLSVNGFYANQGNANLHPEQANTISGGIVLTPHWIDGLRLSADWYSINIKSAIFTPTSAQVLSNCALGIQQFCADMIYAAPGIPVTYPGALNEVILQPQNSASETTSGLDVEADYSTDLFGGTMSWHAVANYNDERTRTIGTTTYDTAGCVGADCPAQGTDLSPKLKATLSSTYSVGPWSGTVQGRFIGAAVLNNYWTSGVQVDNNNVPWVAYLDLQASYTWNENIQLFGAVDNTTNTPPPHTPSTAGGRDANLQIYDGIGRDYRVGIRFNF